MSIILFQPNINTLSTLVDRPTVNVFLTFSIFMTLKINIKIELKIIEKIMVIKQIINN